MYISVNDPRPFELVAVGDSAPLDIDILGGVWTRSGIRLSYDGSTVLAISTSTIEIVYLQYNDSGSSSSPYISVERGDVATVEALLDGDVDDIYFELGRPHTDSNEIIGIDESWMGGDITTGSGSSVYPFKMKQITANGISVTGGKWTRNGHLTEINDTILSGLSFNTTHYMVATISHSGSENPEVYPNTLIITAETVWTPPIDIYNTTKLIGIIIMGASTMEPLDQRWVGGDIDDFAALPDTDASSSSHQSVQLRTGTGHKGETQLYNFNTLGSAQNDDDKVVYINAGAGANIYYDWPVQIDDGSGMRPRNDFDGSSAGFDTIEEITGSGSSAAGTATGTYTPRAQLVNHARLEISDARAPVEFSLNIPTINISGGGINWLDWDPNTEGGPNHDQTDPFDSIAPHNGWAGGGGLSNDDHDQAYFQSVATNRAEVDDFATGGYLHATLLSADLGVANTWDAIDIFVDVSGTVNFVANSTAVLQGTGNVTVESIGANLFLKASTGAIKSTGLDFDVDTNTVDITATVGNAIFGAADNVALTAFNNAQVLGSTVSLDTSAGDITASPFGGNFNLAMGVYEHLGVEGATITDGLNLFSGGILTNAAGWSVIGMRVTPAGGGVPFNINVLGKVI